MSSKPVRSLFIFKTQIKILLMKSESFLDLQRQQRNLNVLWPRKVVRSQDIVKSVHVTSVVQPQFYEATRILFVHKQSKNND